MISVLESPETRELVVPISRAFYHEAAVAGLLDRDVELIQGIILKKMPKSPFHILLVRRLHSLLDSALAEDGLQEDFFIAKEDPIATSDSEPEPDLAIIRGNPEEYISQLPSTARLVIEVAVNTLEKDRLKASVYAVAAVPEYWIVDAAAQQIERFTNPAPDEGQYRDIDTVTAGDLQASFPSSFRVDLARLFASAP